MAYHSAVLTAPQRNYAIHDKELLAIVSCITAWKPELISVSSPFTVLTDHKNLEYFTGTRELSERQHRWAAFLSQFQYHLRYRPGQLSARPDALSRRYKVKEAPDRNKAPVMSPRSVAVAPIQAQQDSENTIPSGATIFADEHMQALWDEAVKATPAYMVRLNAVHKGARSFPTAADTSVQIGDCAISAHGTLLWRGVIWLPEWEPLTTTVIQRAHESGMAGHPGKNATFAAIRRSYHWEGLS